MIASAAIAAVLGFAAAWYWRGRAARCDQPRGARRGDRSKRLNLDATDKNRWR